MPKLLRGFKDFSGGLSEVANDNMRDNELVEARNIIPGERYGISRCEGTRIAYPRIPVTNPQQHRVTRLIEFTPTSGEPQILAAISRPVAYEDIYRFDAGSDSWVKIMSVTPKILDWFIYGGNFYWLNGYSIYKYDGSTITEATITPSGSSPTNAENNLWYKVQQSVAVQQRSQRWFYATRDNEIIFSEIGNPTKFTVTNIINVNTKDGDILTALHEFNDGLLIFKERSVHFLSGWDFASGSDIKLSALNVSSGTRFPDTVRTVENAVLYLGNNGLYQLALSSLGTVIAAANVSEDKLSNRIFNRNVIISATAIVWDNNYYLSVSKQLPSSAGGSQVDYYEYRYYVAKKAFFGEFTQEVSSYAIGLEGEDALFLGCSNGYILRYDDEVHTYVDVNTGEPKPIDIKVKTKGFDVVGNIFQDAKVKKAFLSIKQFVAEVNTIKMQIKADYADDAWYIVFDESLVWEMKNWGERRWGWADTITKQIPIGQKCKRLQFIFSGEIVEPFTLYAVGVTFKKKKVKGSVDDIVNAPIDYPEGL